VVFELEALDRAKKHIQEGHSLRKVAEWLSENPDAILHFTGGDFRFYLLPVS
jgi:hypothetical protein